MVNQLNAASFGSSDRLEIPSTTKSFARQISALSIQFPRLFLKRTAYANGLMDFAIFTHFHESSFVHPLKSFPSMPFRIAHR
jgi:hypothetical protein